jgi:hypothetical protein
MEDFLYNLYDNAQLPFISALALGLMTAISPCPMATNITAIGYISKDLEKRRKRISQWTYLHPWPRCHLHSHWAHFFLQRRSAWFF